MDSIVVSAFYKFESVGDPDAFRDAVADSAERHGVAGSVLIATEGINGTVAASRAGTDAFFGWLRSDQRFDDLITKESLVDFVPFKRLKVKVKPEIVTMRQPVDPTAKVGTYVEPGEWNAVVDNPDVLVIDTRNREEVELGTFVGSADPGTESFTEFVDYVATLDPTEHPTVAMFCTGGIRCEKASSYLLDQGFDEVLHLKGGILQYLEDVDPAESRWEGECFVFDDRVTVDHALQPGGYTLCRGCRSALSDEDRSHPDFEEGVACGRCAGDVSEDRRRRLRERHRQETLARARGDRHIGRREHE